MTLSEILEKLVTHPKLIEFAAEVTHTRDRLEPASEEDDVVRLHEMLVRNRGHIERVQVVANALILFKAKAHREMREAQAALDDAYVASATKKNVGFSDYASAKEKDAHYSLGTIEQTLAYRKAENGFRDVEAVTEFVRSVLRGMEATHRDLETRIRLISMSGQLDR